MSSSMKSMQSFPSKFQNRPLREWVELPWGTLQNSKFIHNVVQVYLDISQNLNFHVFGIGVEKGMYRADPNSK